MRRRLKRLERQGGIAIPQRDGTVKRFSERDFAAAYLCLMDRWRGGEDIPPEHPLLRTVRESSDPAWARTVFADDPDPLEPIPNQFEDG